MHKLRIDGRFDISIYSLLPVQLSDFFCREISSMTRTLLLKLLYKICNNFSQGLRKNYVNKIWKLSEEIRCYMSIPEIHWLHKRLNVRTSYESRVWTELKNVERLCRKWVLFWRNHNLDESPTIYLLIPWPETQKKANSISQWNHIILSLPGPQCHSVFLFWDHINHFWTFILSFQQKCNDIFIFIKKIVLAHFKNQAI